MLTPSQLLLPLFLALGVPPSPAHLSAMTTPAVVASAATPHVTAARVPREFTLLAAGTEASAVGRGCSIVSRQEDLARIARLLPGSVRLPTDIDPHSPLVVIFAGERPTAGYSITIRAVEEDPATASLLVDVADTAPKPGAHAAQAMKTPWEIVRLKPNGEVQTTNCILTTKGGLR